MAIKSKKPEVFLKPAQQRVATGIDGLNYVLGGGLPKHRFYLVQGDPGVGKTTLGLQFLLEGAKQGESVLYVTLSETEDELRSVAASHGWSLEKVNILELNAAQSHLKADHYTLFHPSEVELGETIRVIFEIIDQIQPSRVVFDSLSELRLLARDPLRYRRQILGLKQFMAGRQSTAIILDDRTPDALDLQLQTLVHGVILLEQMSPQFGGQRRRLRVVKMREVKFRGGYHDFSIDDNGLLVFPRLIAAEYRQSHPPEQASSGMPALDQLLGGGLDRGTSTLLMGAAGAGKSALAMQFVMAATQRGERCMMFNFDEAIRTAIIRATGMGMDVQSALQKNLVAIHQIDPAEMSPGEFAHNLRKCVVEQGIRLVVIDSLNGYLNSMPEEKFLTVQMHELLSFLGQHGVITILVVSQHGLLGSSMVAPVDVSYLADTVILLRYYENAGEVHKAVSVVKKRSGSHERAIRELQIASDGLHLGSRLNNLRGILTGVPVVDERQPQNGNSESQHH